MIYAALRLVAAAIACLPRSALPWIGAMLGWVAGSVLRVRRAPVEAAMRRAGVVDPRGTAVRMYRDLGRGLAELMWLLGTRPARRAAVIAEVVIEDRATAALEQALQRGPVILFASHTGNWELAAAAAAQWLGARGRRLAIVAKPIRSRGVDRFTLRLRAALGIDVITPRGALASAQRALDAGAVVAMPIDQVPDRAVHGSSVAFLGASALVDRAPATLARRAGATVLVVAAERDGAHHRVRLLDVLEPLARGALRGPRRGAPLAPRECVIEATATATSRLDAFVRSSPEAWLWLHRRWRMPTHRAEDTPRSLVANHESS
jgi:KDO2-lipid IV(A) lauroyltransferase